MHWIILIQATTLYSVFRIKNNRIHKKEEKSNRAKA
jgi:hypothetical protein